jgi:hypothetical protein
MIFKLFYLLFNNKVNMNKNDELKKLEINSYANNYISDTYEDKKIMLPNLHSSRETKSFYLREDLFGMYFDNMILKTFNENNDICLFQSKYASDYFIEIDFFNFKYNIPQKILGSIQNCNDNNRFYILPLKLIFNYTDAHSNIIIIDNKKERIEFFEPHGDYFKGFDIPYDIETYIKKIIDIIFLKKKEKYNFINVQKNCPLGLQSKQSIINPQSGYCLAWSLLFINIKLINLNLDSDDIIKYFYSFSSNDLNTYIKRFIGFLEGRRKELVSNEFKIELNIELSENDKKKISKRIYNLVNKLNSTTEYERYIINKELISYHNFPNFNQVYFQSINDLKLDPSLMSSFAYPDFYYS